MSGLDGVYDVVVVGGGPGGPGWASDAGPGEGGLSPVSALVKWLLRGGLAGMVLMMAGCVRAPMPSLDLSGPGWRTREAAALWTPGRGEAELAGELLLADRGVAETLVQFSKQGIPLVTARTDSVGWEIRSSLRSGRSTGRGHPPTRVLWFRLAKGEAGTGWEREDLGEGRWRLENVGTGERMEVHPVGGAWVERP